MSARPRGFVEHWAPREETQALLGTIASVLDQYAEQLPLTIRQLFCILVGRHQYSKAERKNEARQAVLSLLDG
jgi:hypothetical protein